MSLGHEQILNPPSSDILVQLICGDIYGKERGTGSNESVLDLVQLICGDIYGKEKGLTREGQF